MWTKVQLAPPDPILNLNTLYNEDTNPNKVNLGVGAYRDENGKCVILDCVHRAELNMVEEKTNHEYAPIDGIKEYVSLARTLAFGKDKESIDHSRIATIQALSGTGSLRIGAEFIKENTSGINIYFPTPTWGNHFNIFRHAGFSDEHIKKYRYYDNKASKLDMAGLIEDLTNAPDCSGFLFHLCAHNPTGLDPTEAEWKSIEEVVAKKKHLIIFDSAYQGFASGDLDKDAWALRYFVSKGHQVILCQSFSKNLGLYGERTGALSIVCGSDDEAKRVLSQLKILARSCYSNPPKHGAEIARRVLGDPELFAQWKKELVVMASRIDDMRKALRSNLEALGSNRDWSHITKQIGMFSFTGLNEAQVKIMIEKYHIYMTSNGRISMAGLNKSNVEYVAKAIYEVTKE